METTSNGIRKETSKSPIMVERVYVGEFQKEGTITAEIKQQITTKSFYPSKKVDSNLQANPFSTSDFGFAEQEFESVETRVAWIPVPVGTTKEQVATKIAAVNAAGGCIYKVLSKAPILDDNQKYAIKQGMKSLDDFANSQAVRYPANDETIANGDANKLILDKNGNVQYKRTFLWLTPQADVDMRNDSNIAPYQSAEIKAELAGASVLSGQTIS